MKKIIVISLLLSAMSYSASIYLARKSSDMKRVAAGLPTRPIVIPEIDRSIPQREVTGFGAPNREVRPVKSSHNVIQAAKESYRPSEMGPYKSPSVDLEPVDPYRREQMEQAEICDSVNAKLRHGVWVFPVIGLLLIAWRKMEEVRIRRLMEMIEHEKEAQGATPPA